MLSGMGSFQQAVWAIAWVIIERPEKKLSATNFLKDKCLPFCLYLRTRVNEIIS
jgi:hypothetical protein